MKIRKTGEFILIVLFSFGLIFVVVPGILFLTMPLLPATSECVTRDKIVVPNQTCHSEMIKLSTLNQSESTSYFWCNYQKPRSWYWPKTGDRLDCLFGMSSVKAASKSNEKNNGSGRKIILLPGFPPIITH